MRCQPRKAIMNLKAAVHGGTPDPSVLDFSVSTNPFPPAPGVLEAFRNADVSRYPDSGSNRLRECIAETYHLDSGEILVTNGTSQAFWLIALTYLDSGDLSLIFSPGYGDYATASRIMGAEVREYVLSAENGFLPDTADLCREIRKRRPKLIWLCNPSNPTGAYLDRRETLEILRCTTECGGILILDEAYVYFVMDGWNSFELIGKGNIIISRSMTKDFGIPGLRLGYVAADEEIIGRISPLQPPWSVNVPAQEAGMKALESLGYYAGEWRKISDLTDRFAASIRELGFRTIPTRSNFMLFVTDPAERYAERLKEFSLIVRDCGSFGLPGYIRVGTRLQEENDRLIDALRILIRRDVSGR